MKNLKNEKYKDVLFEKLRARLKRSIWKRIRMEGSKKIGVILNEEMAKTHTIIEDKN